MPLACHRGDGCGEHFCDRGVAKKTVTVTGACALLPATSVQMWSISRDVFQQQADGDAGAAEISQGVPPACHKGDGCGEYFCDRGVAQKLVIVTGACALLLATSLQMWSINRTFFSSRQTAMQELRRFHKVCLLPVTGVTGVVNIFVTGG